MRMTFSFSGREIRLESIQRIAMRALPSHEAAGFEDRSGFWVELHDAQDRVLYRRVEHNPMAHEIEVYPDEQTREFTRIPLADPAGTFDIVVPDLPDAREFTLYASLPEPAPESETEIDRAARINAGRGRPAQLVARFPIPARDG